MRTLLCLAAVLVLLTVVPAVHAATVSYSANYNDATDVTNQPLTVSQFNASLGTLQSVSFELTGTMTTALQFDPPAGGGRVTWWKNTYTFNLEGQDVCSLFTLSADGTPTNAILNRQYVSGSTIFPGPTLTGSNVFSPTNLTPFIGNDVLTFLLTTVNQDTIGFSPSNGTVGTKTNIDATVKVTYGYAPVPVPSTLLLIIPGLFGLVALRKRLKK